MKGFSFFKYLLLSTFFVSTFYIQSSLAVSCYVLVENSGNFDPELVQSSAVSIISKYIEEVEPPPPAGLRLDDCTYLVNLSESRQGIYISISGKGMNSIGNSTTAGQKGLTQSLLRAVYRTFDSDDQKDRVCRDYSGILENDCKPVEAVIFLFDEKGQMIQQGGSVKEGDQFNVMIQPVNTLYAYIVALDSSGSLFKIFPNSDVTEMKNPLLKGAQYYFPPKSSDLIFAFDNVPGDEKLYFLLSATPVFDIELFFSRLKGIEKEDELEMAAADFEKQFLTRGFKLKKKPHKTTIKQAKAEINTQNKQIVAELLKGSGVLVKTVSLKHVR